MTADPQASVGSMSHSGPDGLANRPLSPPDSSPSSLRGLNPLSSKVTTVLSTSYADSEFRDALSLLDARGVRNKPETRRQLRLDLQKEVIDSNGEIISEFGRVADQLRRIGATIEKLNKSYGDMKGRVNAAHAATSSVLGEATSLMTQRKQVETKQQLLTAFREHFVLGEEEIATLTLTSEPVDEKFFIVMLKAKRISKDCEVLFGFENQTLGLEIMEQTSKNLNLAFQKLYKWIQKEFKTLNLENPRISTSIRHALRVLAERPSLFQNCLDFFAEAREHLLSDAFFAALTGSSPSGVEDRSAKPIELVAHDSLRYVGDMLAWIHSATVSEREALEVLFVSDGDEIARGMQASRENDVLRLIADEAEQIPGFDAVKALNELVDRNVSGAVRILRQRVEQVIQNNEDVILAYKLSNLLNFYRLTFAKLLKNREHSVLVDTLSDVETEAMRLFRSLMRDHVATLQGDFQHTPVDLGPPDFLRDALGQLAAIMKTYDTSLTSAENRERDFEPILVEALDPFIRGCENMAKNMRTPDDCIFLVNCYMTAKSALAYYDFTVPRLQSLQESVDRQLPKLCSCQHEFFRRGSGMDEILTALHPLHSNKDDILKAIDLPQFKPEVLRRTSQALDDFLPSALMDALENVKHLQDSRIAREVTEGAAERFCGDFERVEELVELADELARENGEVDRDEDQTLRAVFPRTSGEIRVLLS